MLTKSSVCTLYTLIYHPYCRSGYNGDEIYAKVDDMTYYPVNSMLVSLPTTAATTAGSTVSSSNLNQQLHHQLHPHSTASTIRAGSHGDQPPPPPPPTSLPPGSFSSSIPTPPGAPSLTKTLNLHNYHGQHTTLVNPRQTDFHAAFGTVHRSQKIYL